MIIDINVLKAYNENDIAIEKVRNIELSILAENRYRLTDDDYAKQYNAIYDKFEKLMYRKWTTKDLVITGVLTT